MSSKLFYQQDFWALLALATIVGLRYYLLRFGFMYVGFTVPPGGDAANHLMLAQSLRDSQTFFVPGSIYPPGFHLLLNWMSIFYHNNLLETIKILGPITAILPIIATFVMAKKWFSPRVAVLAAALVGLVAVSPIASYMDGNYPNLMGSGFFMILGFTYLVEAFRYQPLRNGIIAAVMFTLLALTHHLSFILMLVILFVYLFVISIFHWFGKYRLPHFMRVYLISLCTLIVGSIIAYLIFGKTLLLPALTKIFSGAAPGFSNAYLARPLGLGDYGATLNLLLITASIFGLILIINSANKLRLEHRLLLIVWIGILIILSRLPIIGIPTRLTRELAVPFAITGALAFDYLIAQTDRRWKLIAALGIIGILLTANIAMLFTPPAQIPDSFKPMVWLDNKDLPKVAALQKLPDGVTIAMTPSSPYFSALVPHKLFIATPDAWQADYIFISTLPKSNPDPIAYPYFAGFDSIEKKLRAYPYAQTIVTFSDGSVIKKILPPR